MLPVRIGRREVDVALRPALGLHEAAAVLRCSEHEARLRMRRGGLPVRWAGRRRLVDVVGLAELLAGDALALEALAGMVEGRIRVPRHAAQPPLATLVARAAGA